MINGEFITVSGLVSVFYLLWRMGRDTHQKVNRVYQRLDNIKERNDTTYTHKDVCQVLHTQLQTDIKEIKQDIKSLLRKNGIK